MKLHFELSGDRGDTLLMVHGFPFNHSMWDAARAALADDFRVLAPDLRGLGMSARERFLAPDAPRVTSMADFADDLAELLDDLGLERVTFCGLSMGGYVGLEFWRRHTARMERLIFCDSNVTADPPERRAQREALADRILREESVGFMVEATRASLLAPETLAQNLPPVAKHREMALANPYRGVAAAARGMAVRHDFSRELGDIRVPVLVVAGEHDALSPPAMMATIAQRVPFGEFAAIPDAGHLAPLENPQAFVRAVRRFLDTEHEPGGAQ